MKNDALSFWNLLRHKLRNAIFMAELLNKLYLSIQKSYLSSYKIFWVDVQTTKKTETSQFCIKTQLRDSAFTLQSKQFYNIQPIFGRK